MPRIQARHIEELAPGHVIEIDGREYIRITDIQDSTGLVADLASGWAGSWAKLTLHDEMVTITRAP